MRLLIAESEPAEARQRRRESVGRSSGETFIEVLTALAPGARCDRVTPADAGSALPKQAALEGYDGVLLTGSPLHVYDDTPEVRRELEFMRAVFRSGTPAFGSCAGLQVATMAAGGAVRSMQSRREAGLARRITATEAGRDHLLLKGRPPAWDAPAIHTDEVETLPPGATLLATNSVTKVQAAEIRHDGGVFWGVQYHPEISLAEVAGALRRQASDLVSHRLALSQEDIETTAASFDQLHEDGSRVDLSWRLGVDGEVISPERRRTELRNFIDHLVVPTQAARGRERMQSTHQNASLRRPSKACSSVKPSPFPM